MSRPTAADKRHWGAVAYLGCLICGGPAIIHHCRHECGLGQRNHSQVAPLCSWHHQHGPISRHGTGSKEFQEQWPDKWLCEETKRRLG